MSQKKRVSVGAVRHRRTLFLNSVDEGVSALNEMNAKEARRVIWRTRDRGVAVGHRTRGERVLAERPTDAEDDLWYVAARRAMDSRGTRGQVMVTPEVVRAERFEIVYFWIAKRSCARSGVGRSSLVHWCEHER